MTFGSLVRGLLCLALLQGSIRTAVAQEGQAVGTVAGTVLDKGSGDPIIEAGVEVVDQGKRTTTDLDGKFSLKLVPGSYTLRIFAPLYQSVRLQNVVVKANEVTRTNAALASEGQAGVEVVEVVAQANRAAESAQLLQRKTASVVKEVISAEVIKKTPGSDAGDIAKRTPAVTVRDEKFVFVRGLGERYTSALLNGSRLPSTDPLKRVVPLDLFPADFLESLAIVKTFSPDLPADFSGGLVELNLRDFPEQLAYSLGVSVGGNTQTTTRPYLTYRGSDLDYVGLGEGFRNPPSDVPSDPDELNSLPENRQLAIGRSFKDIWQLESADAPPNFGANFSIGNSYGPFGFQLGGVYTTEYETRLNEIRNQFTNAGTPDDPQIELFEPFRSNVSQFRVRLGGVLTSAYKIGDNHKLSFRSLVNRNSVDEGRFDQGLNLPNNGENTVQNQERLRYLEEELAYGQLAGEHNLDWLRIDWRSALARTTADEPDTRHTTYIGPIGGPLDFSQDSLGGLRISNETRERLTDSMVDFTIPFKTWLPGTDVWAGLPGKFKFGPAYSFRDRDFQQRRFRFTVDQAILDPTLPPNTLLDPDNIVPGGGVRFGETTSPTDHFQARQEIAAGYGLLELPIIRDRLRVIGGVRGEYSLIRLDTELVGDCPGDQSVCAVRFRKKNTDFLPGINVVISPLDDMNVRLSYGQSVSRPEFRELAPTEFPSVRGDRAKRGNPDLVQAEITSWDARWEWFFSPLELVSLGFFYKDLQMPIEQVVTQRSAGLIDTWINAENGEITGFEFEGRKNFAFIHDALRDVSFLANVTYADSEVFVPQQRIEGVLTQQTNENRQLNGQAPFIVNAAIEYANPELFTARILYFTADRTLEIGGTAGLPDIFLERRDQLDAVVLVPLKRWTDLPLQAKLSVENILNAPYVFTQGDFIQRKYTSGVKLSLGVSYTY